MAVQQSVDASWLHATQFNPELGFVSMFSFTFFTLPSPESRHVLRLATLCTSAGYSYLVHCAPGIDPDQCKDVTEDDRMNDGKFSNPRTYKFFLVK